MTGVLFYADPHPVGESLTRYERPVRHLVRLARQVRDCGVDAFVFTNNETCNLIVEDDPDAAYYLIRPVAKDEAKIEALLEPWTEDSVADWMALTSAGGRFSGFYTNLLRRVHDDFPFDLVVSWGGGGAVGQAAEALGAKALHMAWGPTGAAFGETFYFDHAAPSTGAAFRRDSALLDAAGTLPAPEFWIGNSLRDKTSKTEPSFYDVGMMFGTEEFGITTLDYERTCYVPLQLADDPGPRTGSRFATPLAFLEAVLPRLVAAGYRPILQPHPDAHSRAFNLISENAALTYAAGLGEDVMILPADPDPMFEAWILGNVDLVVSVNAPAAFEAALLGVPVLLAGEAVYDFGMFPRLDDRPLPEIVAGIDGAAIRTAVRVMLGRVLYPAALLSSRHLGQALVDLRAPPDGSGDTLSARLRARLGRPADLVCAWPGEVEDDPVPGGTGDAGEQTGDTAGDGPVLQALPPTPDGFIGSSVLQTGATLTIGGLRFDLADSAFTGGVERIGIVRGKDKGRRKADYTVTGWAYKPRSRIPPLCVLISAGDRVIASRPVAEPRPHIAGKNPLTRHAGFTLTGEMPAGGGFARAAIILIGQDGSARTLPMREGRYL